MKFPRFLQISVDFSQILAFPATRPSGGSQGFGPVDFYARQPKLVLLIPLGFRVSWCYPGAKLKKPLKTHFWTSFWWYGRENPVFGHFGRFWTIFGSILSRFRTPFLMVWKVKFDVFWPFFANFGYFFDGIEGRIGPFHREKGFLIVNLDGIKGRIEPIPVEFSILMVSLI